MIVKGLNPTFSTPVYRTNITEDLTGITQHLLTEYGDANKKSANVSGDNIFDDPILNKFKEDHVIPRFRQFCSPYLELYEKDYDIRGWLTGYGTNYAMPKHNHSGSHVSAVFYLLCENNHGGDIILHDPRTNANRGYIPEFSKMFDPIRFTPQTGDVLMFPSFLYHNVETFRGKIRLALPVDLTIYK